MDSPDDDSVLSAFKTLWILGALDQRQQLTDSGRKMAAFPVDPVYACAIVASAGYHCTSEVVDIISVISASSKLFVDISDQRDAVAEQRRKFRHPSGDHMTILNVLRAYEETSAGEGQSGRKDKAARKEWCRKHFLNERTLIEAQDIRSQLRTVCERENINWMESALKKTAGAAAGSVNADGVIYEEDPILKALGHGLCGNAAFLQPDGTYKQIMGPSVSPCFLMFLLASYRCYRPSRSTQVLYSATRRCQQLFTTNWYASCFRFSYFSNGFLAKVFTNHIYARGVSAIPKSFFATHEPFKQKSA
jgi:ATP-dependent RNA helicase DHX33